MNAAAPPLTLPPLVDQHCHGVVRCDLEPDAFERFLTESDGSAAPGTTFFDTQLGFAVRRWCPPLLDLEPHCPPERYLARRRELGALDATRRLLRGSGVRTFLVDAGIAGDLATPEELAAVGGATTHEVVRLEKLAEQVAERADRAEAYADLFAETVAAAAADPSVVGLKSIVAYRHGLHFDPRPPRPAEVREAAGRWFAELDRTGEARRADPVLLRHALWCAVRTGLPLQLHTGFGDPDLRLHHCDPLLLTDFIHAIRSTGCPLVLLHGYPFHRHVGYLANVFPHVYADVGLALTHTGARAEAVLAEFLELAPFGKLLFSTDAYGLPELYVVGTRLFTQALQRLLTGWVTDGAWSRDDAERVAALIAAGNALRLYEIDG